MLKRIFTEISGKHKRKAQIEEPLITEKEMQELKQRFYAIEKEQREILNKWGTEMNGKMRIEGVQVNGTFDIKRFYETLALILSRKENMSITVKVHEDTDQREMTQIRKGIGLYGED